MTGQPADTVYLARSALDVISQEVKVARDGLETGGILLGHLTEEGTFGVRHAGRPGPKAIRTERSFSRDRAYAQALADDAWGSDRSQWIGEWHTHPRGPLQPSVVDVRTYLSLLQDPDLGFDRFLSVIAVPMNDDFFALAGWAVASAEVTRLVLVTDPVDASQEPPSPHQ